MWKRISFFNPWQPELTHGELVKEAASRQEMVEQPDGHGPSNRRAEAAEGRVLQAREDKPGTLAEEEEEWEDNSDKEVSQREDMTVYKILDSELAASAPCGRGTSQTSRCRGTRGHKCGSFSCLWQAGPGSRGREPGTGPAQPHSPRRGSAGHSPVHREGGRAQGCTCDPGTGVTP